MRRRLARRGGACTLLFCLAATAIGEAPPEKGGLRRAFPLRPVGAGVSRLQLEPDVEALDALRGARAVVFDSVALPDGAEVDLVLTEVRVTDENTVFAVDGSPHPFVSEDDGLSMWRGRVAGDPDSFVFLAFSPFGSRGVIRSHGRVTQLTAEPDPVHGWTFARSALAEIDPERSPALTSACRTADMAQPLARSPAELAEIAASPGIGAYEGTTYECRVAVETDWQFYQLFGNEDAARTYALTLMGAVSAFYVQEVGCAITVPYLGIHTSSGDPWSEQDGGGGDSLNLLFEFRDEWSGGNAPVQANLYHFLSGASLGGGVAYIDVLCSQNYGFGVSGDLEGNLTFPVSQGYGTWDFVVVAHELGHNFSSPHTHDYCPPIDQCTPMAYKGPCQTSQVCSTAGTIMSYCHLCAGGMNNITMDFGATVEATIRAAVVASCLDEYVPPTTLCVSGPSSVEVTCAFSGDYPSDEVIVLDDCTDSGSLDFAIEIVDDDGWLGVSPMSGTITAGTVDLTLSFNPIALGTGTYVNTLRAYNVDQPENYVDVPVTLTVTPRPFRAGDELLGDINHTGDVDAACFDAVKNATFQVSLTLEPDDGPFQVVVLDPAGKKVAKWNAAPGSTLSKQCALEKNGQYEVKVQAQDGVATGDFILHTSLDFPAAAEARTKTLSAVKKQTFSDYKFSALAGAELSATAAPNAKFAGPLVLSLFDPDGNAVDLAAYTSGDGLTLTGVPLEVTGKYRLRVSGYGGNKKEKVTLSVTPDQPAGTDSVFID